MAYSIGYISGAHFNPAVTIGLGTGGRYPVRDITPYVVTQVAGAIAAAWIICVIASGQPSFTLTSNSLAVNGIGQLSPRGYSIGASLLIE